MGSQALGFDPGAQTATDPQAQVKYMLAVTQARIHSGANWFNWIAGLSVVNAVILVFQIPVRFPVGLGMTQAMLEIGSSRGAVGIGIGFVMTLAVAGVFVLMWHFTKQGQKWALILGIVFYTLDALLVLVVQQWLMLAFHVYALFVLFRVFSSISLYRQVKDQAAAQGIFVNP